MFLRKTTRLVVIALILVVISSCKKEDTGRTTQLRIYLTDKPFNASAVNVDIKQVRVNFSDDSTGWININTRAGVYNLLDLQNGIDTVLAQGIVPAGILKEIRFILGSNNSIKVDSTAFPLTIPSGSESGLKIKLNKQLGATLDSLVIDFNVALSVLQAGNGDYKLKPVLIIR